jgi:hypothetical protein
VGPRADLDDVERRKFLTLAGLEVQTPSRPVRSQSLYRQSYPGSSTQLPPIPSVLQLYLLQELCQNILHEFVSLFTPLTIQGDDVPRDVMSYAVHCFILSDFRFSRWLAPVSMHRADPEHRSSKYSRNVGNNVHIHTV